MHDNREMRHEIKVFRHTDPLTHYKLKIRKIDSHRDLAICDLEAENGNPHVASAEFPRCVDAPKQMANVTLYGFPSYKKGQTPHVTPAQIGALFVGTIEQFELTMPIRHGHSGGPVLNAKREVIGVALKSTYEGLGNNLAVRITELDNLI